MKTLDLDEGSAFVYGIRECSWTNNTTKEHLVRVHLNRLFNWDTQLPITPDETKKGTLVHMNQPLVEWDREQVYNMLKGNPPHEFWTITPNAEGWMHARAKVHPIDDSKYIETDPDEDKDDNLQALPTF